MLQYPICLFAWFKCLFRNLTRFREVAYSCYMLLYEDCFWKPSTMPFRLDEARSLARLQHKSHVQRASLVGCTVHLDASPSLASWPNICKAGSLTIMYKIGLCSVSLDQIALCPFEDQTNQPTCLTFLCMSCQKTGDLLELLMNHHHFLHRSGGREEAGLEFGLNSKSWASSSGK